MVFDGALRVLAMGLCQYPITCIEPTGYAGGIVGISTFPGHDRGLVGGGDRVSVCARMYENRPAFVGWRFGMGENGARTPQLIGGVYAEEG